MGYDSSFTGRVTGVARGITIPNVQPDSAGLATVNPIFAWVRLAQRAPVRVQIDHVPEAHTTGRRHDGHCSDRFQDHRHH